ncbi:MAG: N-acetylmuramoyl-L-alanine amidase [Verrucomicrobiota bacterium]
MIDPGHGGTAVAGSLAERSNSSPNNATSPGGFKEKDLTLEFSKILQEEIIALANRTRQRVGVDLTRKDDRNLDFRQRAAACNHPDTVAVVSIHFNAGGGGKAKGSLALISAPSRNPNYDLDKAFGEGLAAACSAGVSQFVSGSRSRGTMTDGHLHGGLGSNFFFQLARQQHLRDVPKCFLEVEFIDNPAVEAALLREGRIEKFRAIAQPIAEYLLDYATGTASGQ